MARSIENSFHIDSYKGFTDGWHISTDGMRHSPQKCQSPMSIFWPKKWDSGHITPLLRRTLSSGAKLVDLGSQQYRRSGHQLIHLAPLVWQPEHSCASVSSIWLAEFPGGFMPPGYSMGNVTFLEVHAMIKSFTEMCAQEIYGLVFHLNFTHHQGY